MRNSGASPTLSSETNRRIGHPDTDPNAPALASLVAIESGRRQSRSADADVRDLVRLRTEHWPEREVLAGD